MMDLTANSGISPETYGGQASALLIAGDGAPAQAMDDALAQSGIRVRGRYGFAEAAGALGDHGPYDLLAIDAVGASDELADAIFARADLVARERRLCLVASVSADQIDYAANHLMGPRRQLLCDPNPRDLAVAIAMARWQMRELGDDKRVYAPVHDARDGEGERLQRLNEEVARIAEALARLTRDTDMGVAPGVREPGNGYRGENGEDVQVSAQEIRSVIRARRLRGQFFRADLFADPAWDMLLDLFAAGLERRHVSVSSLCIAAAVPPTTALRWIGTLHDAGLFERQADPSDRRRAHVALSEKGLSGMRGYISAAKRQGLGLA